MTIDMECVFCGEVIDFLDPNVIGVHTIPAGGRRAPCECLLGQMAEALAEMPTYGLHSSL